LIISINSIEDNVIDIQSDRFTTNKILLHGYYNGKSGLMKLLGKLDINIDFYSGSLDFGERL